MKKYRIIIEKLAEKFIIKLPKPDKERVKGDSRTAGGKRYKASERQEKHGALQAPCGRLPDYLDRKSVV